MPLRRSHEKSHHGCVTCKRRRVKCDETRPKCTNCKRRNTECTYLSGYVSTTPESTNGGDVAVLKNGSNTFLGQISESRPLQQAAPWSRDISSISMNDLLLMNNWTSATWKTLVDRETEQRHMWQSAAVTEAVLHPFLMHEILALSALHLASESGHNPEKGQEHRAVALRHHDQSLALFRPVLSNFTAENSTAIFAFSALLVISSFALPGFPLHQTTKSPVEELLTIIPSLKGIRDVLASGTKFIKQGSLASLLDSRLTNIRGDVPDDFEAALARLKAHNTSLYANETRMMEAYGQTIDQLEQCVGRLFGHPLDRPVILGWMVIVPEAFDTLLRDGHGFAQVILAHFGVCLLTFDFWWAGDWGSSLIKEISQTLTDEWKPMIRWPLEQLTSMNAQALKARLGGTTG